MELPRSLMLQPVFAMLLIYNSLGFSTVSVTDHPLITDFSSPATEQAVDDSTVTTSPVDTTTLGTEESIESTTLDIETTMPLETSTALPLEILMTFDTNSSMTTEDYQNPVANSTFREDLDVNSTLSLTEVTPEEKEIPITTTTTMTTTTTVTTTTTTTTTKTTTMTLPPKFRHNLKSLSMILYNASSSAPMSLSHSPLSLSYNHNPPPPQPHNPQKENNNILTLENNNIDNSILLHLDPAFSSSATQQPHHPPSAPSSSSSYLFEKEEYDRGDDFSSTFSSSSSSSSSYYFDPSSSSSVPMTDGRLRVTSPPDSIANITGELGGSVFLPCTTHHSMERQVSWVRRRDWHILTSGTLAYTKEERFSVHHPEGSTDWTLVIKYVKLDDEGTYECQVSTGTGILSRLIELDVVVPKAVIPGNGEYHIDVGSTITLDCFIHQSLVAPQYIFWYHNSKMINYDRERGGVNVHIETGPQVRSRLTVKRATPADSGNYTCAAANSKPAYTTVYITNGNKIAAIQPRAIASGTRLKESWHLVASVLCLLQLVSITITSNINCIH